MPYAWVIIVILWWIVSAITQAKKKQATQAKLKEEQDSFSAMGIDYEEKAFYDILIAVAEKFQFEFPESENIELAKEIRAALRDKEKYADWANSARIKALMQADIIIILAKHGYPPTPPEIYEKVYNDILEQAENFKKYSD